ncbi:MAG: ABC transporter permease [Vicinamibacterales bacterium]
MFTFKYAARTLLRSPGFFAIAVATIALGIAANSAIFSVVNGVLLRPLPFPDEERVVKVITATQQEKDGNHSAGDFMDLRQRNRTLAALAGFRNVMVGVAATAGNPILLEAAWVTPDFFDVLAAPTEQGRAFSAADKSAGQALVVIGHDAAQQLFAVGTPAVGRTVRIDGESYTVAAVMPAGFAFPSRARLWMLSPLAVPPAPVDLKDPLTNRDVQYFESVARLKPAVSLATAQQDLHAIAVSIQQEHPQTSGGRDLRALPIRDSLVGGVRDALLMIQAAVGLVLLIACANVSSLLIARATGRRRDLAIRTALGASRVQLIRQLLAESLIVGVCGGLAGLLVASWLVALLVRILPSGVPRIDAITLDTTVMVVTLVASVGSGILFGILPALQASRTRAVHAIKEAGTRGGSRPRGRSALVVAEIALTLVLLAGAGLLANSFLRLQRVDAGFDPEDVTISYLMLPQSRYPKGADQTRLYRRLLDGLLARPELQAVGVGFPGPFNARNASGTFFIEGSPSATRADRPFAHLAAVSGGYFAAMGIPLLAGRTFEERDVETAPPVAVVSASMARRYWPGQDPIGRRLRFDEDETNPWFTVVGLVGDVRQLGLRVEAPPLLFLPYAQFALPVTSVAVRSSLPQAAVTALVKSQLAAIDPDLPLGRITSLQAEFERNVDQPRFRAMLIGVFAVLALALAAIGVYGLISFTVTERTREIGIRVALGAAPRQVIVPVIREGIGLALAGIAIGLAGAAAAARALSAFLFGVGASDPLTFSGVALLMLFVAFVASYIPSRRASRIDPVLALRAE